MDIYLLKLIWQWISVFFVALVSLFHSNSVKVEKENVENYNYLKNAIVINQIINYETEYKYNSDREISSKPIVIQNGSVGLAYFYSDGTKKVVKQPTKRIVEIGVGRAVSYVGRLTSYNPYCIGCSKYGNVACKVNGKSFSLITNGHYYVDSTYGRVRIVAADLKGFPCGTIVNIDNGVLPAFVAVVLDTGGSMRQAFKKGVVWMDLAYSNKGIDEARFATSKNTKFEVLRWGW